MQLQSTQRHTNQCKIPPILNLQGRAIPLQELPLSTYHSTHRSHKTNQKSHQRVAVKLGVGDPKGSKTFFMSKHIPQQDQQTLSHKRIFCQLFKPTIFPTFRANYLSQFKSFCQLYPIYISNATFPTKKTIPFQLCVPNVIFPTSGGQHFPNFLFPNTTFPTKKTIISQHCLLQQVAVRLKAPHSPS